MNVSVAYVGPEGVALVDVAIDEGSSVGDAIDASGIVSRLRLFEGALGYAIYGEAVSRETPVREGDRVELLRPLVADPKDARRQRASDRPLRRSPPVKKPGRSRS